MRNLGQGIAESKQQLTVQLPAGYVSNGSGHWIVEVEDLRSL